MSVPDLLGSSLFTVGASFTLIWLMLLGRGLTFFYDEWDFIDTRNQSFWSVDLTPHNGHPVVVPFAIYRLALQLVGLRHYWPYVLLVAGANILCGWLLFVLLRKKLHPAIAASAACLLMLLGPAWQDLLWPFQIGFFGSMAGGLGALVLLDRHRGRADVGALACLVIAVLSSGIGLTMVAGIAVGLLWDRGDWRRLWVPVGGAAVFVLWYLTEARGSSSLTVTGASASAHFIGQSVAGVSGALVGRGTKVGAGLSIALCLLVVVAFFRRPRDCGRLAMAVVGGLTFWILTLLTRGSDPTASRYLYPGAVYVLLAIGELPRLLWTPPWKDRMDGHEEAKGHRFTRILVPALVVVYAAISIWWNSAVLNAGRGGLLGVAQTVRAELTAVQIAGRVLPHTFQPDTTDMPQVVAEPYLRAVSAFGSPADSLSQLYRQPESVRASVDAMLLRGHPMVVTPVQTVTEGAQLCSTVKTDQGLIAHLPPNGIWITAPQSGTATIRVRAYGSSYTSLTEVVPAGQTAHLTWTGMATPISWSVDIQSSNAPQVACPADRATP